MTADRILRAIDATLTATEAHMPEPTADQLHADECAFCVAPSLRRLPNGACASCPIHGTTAAPYDAGDAAPRRHIALTPPTPDEQIRTMALAAATAEHQRDDAQAAAQRLEAERDDLRIQLANVTADRDDARAALRTAHRTLTRLWANDEERERIWTDHDTIDAPAQDAAEPPHSASGGTEAHDGAAEAHRGAEGAAPPRLGSPRPAQEGPSLIEAMEDVHRHGDRAEHADRAQEPPAAADLLRMAAAGRREYARAIPEKAEPLDLQAHTLDAAARVVEGDLAPLYDWLPSWQWTGEMNARLHPTAAAMAERTPVPEYHWGRAWSPSSDEATCPCPKAPCGYVVRSSEPTGCDLHGLTQTMRGGHPADRCPGKREG
ncbi:hypothetical protein ACGFIG_09395 [Micromonospora sp. NPDC049048]|uniref:hypothetical protein n=1 Tax=Micromonospora sp. NPDC049048 TaxID=3364263 RepID=UPI00371D0844